MFQGGAVFTGVIFKFKMEVRSLEILSKHRSSISLSDRSSAPGFCPATGPQLVWDTSGMFAEGAFRRAEHEVKVSRHFFFFLGNKNFFQTKSFLKIHYIWNKSRTRLIQGDCLKCMCGALGS